MFIRFDTELHVVVGNMFSLFAYRQNVYPREIGLKVTKVEREDKLHDCEIAYTIQEKNERKNDQIACEKNYVGLATHIKAT